MRKKWKKISKIIYEKIVDFKPSIEKIFIYMYINSEKEPQKIIQYTNQATSFMKLDISLFFLEKGSQLILNNFKNEKAFDLLQGEIKVEIKRDKEKKNYFWKRKNVFHDRPSVVLADKRTVITIDCLSNNCEILVEETKNETEYGMRIYEQKDIVIEKSGVNQSKNLTNRKVLEFFSYQSVPESKMALGEVICTPGQWASWPPHKHSQPEMYLFKFNKTEGFGVSFVGHETYRVQNNDAVCIPGQLLHPTVSAPGYIMWYAWLIPNLDNNPWITREYDEKYQWTTTNDWEESEMN